MLLRSPCPLTPPPQLSDVVPPPDRPRRRGSAVTEAVHLATAQAKAAAATSRLRNRRESQGFVRDQLRASAGPLPHTIRLDLLTVDCSPVITTLLTLAHAACEFQSGCWPQNGSGLTPSPSAALRVTSYVDARCLRAHRALAAAYSAMVHELKRTPQDAQVRAAAPSLPRDSPRRR